MALARLSMLSMSKWLVGSSRKSMCGHSLAILASTTRLFCPSESCPITTRKHKKFKQSISSNTKNKFSFEEVRDIDLTLCLNGTRNAKTTKKLPPFLSGHVRPQRQEVVKRRETQIQYVDEMLSELADAKMSVWTNGSSHLIDIHVNTYNN